MQNVPRARKRVQLMPLSDAQRDANRANAQHSTGPRTPEGKHRSSLNAYRHGLTAQVVVLTEEDLKAYQSFCQDFFEDLDPKTSVEQQLVQTLIDTQWLLNHCHAQEHSLFALGHFTEAADIDVGNREVHSMLTSARQLSGKFHELDVLSRHGQRLSRRFQSTLQQLQALQASRREREQQELSNAADIRKLHEMKEIPYNPAEFGFVLKIPQIDTYLRLTETLGQASLAKQVGYDREEFRRKSGTRSVG